jgi:Tol biopolymer transport system component
MPPGDVPGDFDPIWSPDGKSLLVPLTLDDGQTRPVWELPVDGSPPRAVPADDPRSNRLSSVSPDGTQFASVVGPALIVAGADGSQPRELVSDGVSSWFNAFPLWSPGGDRVAFAGGTEDVTSDLQIVDVATGATTPVVAGRNGVYLGVIAFSPDGDRLLYSRTDDAGGRELWSVRVDGSDPRLLVPGTYQGEWQPLPANGSRQGG